MAAVATLIVAFSGARAAVFNTSEGKAPKTANPSFVPPPSSLDLRLGHGSNTVFSDAVRSAANTKASAVPPEISAIEKFYAQTNLVLCAMEMERLRQRMKPQAWTKMPLGDVYYTIGWHAEAVAFCRETIAANPDLDVARQILAASLLALGSNADARAAAVDFIRRKPASPTGHYILACIEAADKKPDAALTAANNALRCDDRLADAWKVKARTLVDLGRAEESLKATKVYVDLQGETTEAALLMAQSYEMLGDYDKAALHFKAATSSDRPPLDALLARANYVERHSTRLDDAIEILERAIDLYPRAGDAHAELGRMYEKGRRGGEAPHQASAAAYFGKDFDEALARALDGITADREQPINYINASVLFQRRGDLKDAESWAAQGAARFPENLVAQIRYAQVLAAQTNVAKAIAFLTNMAPNVAAAPAMQFELARQFALAGDYVRASSIGYHLAAVDPTPALFRHLGDWNEALGKYDKARDSYAEGLRRDPLDPDIMNGYVYACLHLGAPSATILLPLARKAYSVTDGDPSVGDTLGWALAESGQAGEALQVLADAMKRMPDEPTPAFHYALACSRTNKPGEARATLEKITASGKSFPDQAQAAELLRSLAPEKK